MRFSAVLSAPLLSLFSAVAVAQEAPLPYQFFDGEFDSETQTRCFDAKKMGNPNVQLSTGHVSVQCLGETVNDTKSVRTLMEAMQADVLLHNGALEDMHSADTGKRAGQDVPASIIYYGETTHLPAGCLRTRFAVIAGKDNTSNDPEALGAMVVCPTPTAYRTFMSL